MIDYNAPTVRALGADALALLAGAVSVLAYAPFEFYPLAPVALALLGIAWQGASPRRAAWRGLLFGLGLYGCGIYWVYISLHTYGHAPPAFAGLATALLVLYLALYPTLAGYLLNRLWPRPGVGRWLLAWPALWLLLEWVRSWLLTGFPWLAPGYSQTSGPLAGLAPVVGVAGVGWAVLASAGLLLLLGYGPRRWCWLLLLVALWGGAWSLTRITWVSPAGAPLKVSLIQGDIDQDQKWEPQSLTRTLDRYRQLSARAAPHSNLIVWPETAIPLFIEDVDPAYLQSLHRLARQTGTDFLIGAPSGNPETGRYYNGVLAIGRQSGFYRKHHLLPFGEYLPLRWLFELFHSYVDIPMADFTPGRLDQPLLHADGYPVGVSICFEAAFGEQIRQALPQAAFLVNVSNDGWFGDSLAPAQHLQIDRMRALEMGRYLARATNTGITALIDPQGRIVARGPQFKVTVVEGTLVPLAGATPYVRYGDKPVLATFAGLLLLALLCRRPSPQPG